MRKIILGLLAVATLCLPVAAQTKGKAPPPPALTSEQQARLPAIEAYLNDIRSLKSQFIQSSDDGAPLATGTFQMLRPGRMRIDYDGNGNYIVADGRFVYFWDAEVKEQQNAPIGSTLADFLLRDKITLAGDVTVARVGDDDGLLEITLVQTKEPGQGSLTLVFEERPFSLRKWRVLDAQGRTTEVALQNPQFGVSLDKEQFYFREPGRQRERD
ncbi:cell envelope biogenesis protein LolA [Niveispirillum lacus]|uniref:Cell envelope biogenesis protein LolA n=1 Tax=Niveispirillum lacus TaxID=1981099 RepID=A0A255Z4P5_9PROT|nr:outer membrane lipoprotein carrier protein LolA [Niveispirillum lacus]OYQ35884.1 cell envelope biogenesis protein LolA [Niveispirillum lacus]